MNRPDSLTRPFNWADHLKEIAANPEQFNNAADHAELGAHEGRGFHYHNESYFRGASAAYHDGAYTTEASRRRRELLLTTNFTNTLRISILGQIDLENFFARNLSRVGSYLSDLRTDVQVAETQVEVYLDRQTELEELHDQYNEELLFAEAELEEALIRLSEKEQIILDEREALEVMAREIDGATNGVSVADPGLQTSYIRRSIALRELEIQYAELEHFCSSAEIDIANRRNVINDLRAEIDGVQEDLEHASGEFARYSEQLTAYENILNGIDSDEFRERLQAGEVTTQELINLGLPQDMIASLQGEEITQQSLMGTITSKIRSGLSSLRNIFSSQINEAEQTVETAANPTSQNPREPSLTNG